MTVRMFAGMNPNFVTQAHANGWRILHMYETGSTNSDLMAMARSGEAAGLVVRADSQTAGRGRLGRVWEAPPSQNLLCSLLFRPTELEPPVPANQLHILTAAVALAAADACAAMTTVRPSLKWPNDLLVGERKLAGILAESVFEGVTPVAVVVGIGLNVNGSPEGAVDMASLAGHSLDVGEVLDRMLTALDVASAAARYPGALMTIGRRVRVEFDGGTLVGQATGITDEGRLIVLDESGERHDFSVGDVVHVRNQI